MWKCAIDTAQRKANLQFLNSLLLEVLQLTCKISHASPTGGWSTKCLFFPFLEASVYYTVYYNISWIHNFLPSVLYSEWQPKQWDYLLSLTTPDLSRGLDWMTLRAPSSLSVLWCLWTFFRAPSCWMHVCSSYIRTLTFFTAMQQNKTLTWTYVYTNNFIQCLG